MAASQTTIDDAARAIAQERLDCSLTWRQIAAKVHGFPEPQRNLVATPRTMDMPPTREGGAYYDRIIETESVSNKVADQTKTATVTPAAIVPGSIPASKPALSTAIKSAIAAGGILGAGAAGYFWPKGETSEPAATQQPTPGPDGNLLDALRQRGYHLPPGGAIKK